MLSVTAGGQWVYKKSDIVSQLSDIEHVTGNCSNESTCPTWFTCNSRNRCQCKNSDNDGIMCDNQNLLF